MGRSVFELPVVEKFKSIGLVSDKGVYTGHDLVGGHMCTRLRQNWPLLTVVLPIPLKKKMETLAYYAVQASLELIEIFLPLPYEC